MIQIKKSVNKSGNKINYDQVGNSNRRDSNVTYEVIHVISKNENTLRSIRTPKSLIENDKGKNDTIESHHKVIYKPNAAIKRRKQKKPKNYTSKTKEMESFEPAEETKVITYFGKNFKVVDSAGHITPEKDKHSWVIFKGDSKIEDHSKVLFHHAHDTHNKKHHFESKLEVIDPEEEVEHHIIFEKTRDNLFRK